MSSLSLYFKMAAGAMRRNKTMYIPYLLSVSFSLALFYILASVEQMIRYSTIRGSSTISRILLLCLPLYQIVAVIFLFYVNSFLIKRRKKEFGLYRILGMERRHVCIMLIFEVSLVCGISILLAILSGSLLSQLMFLVLLKIVHIPADLNFQIPFGAVFSTVLLTIFGFLLVLLYDIASVSKTDPATLLRQNQEGEQEPKSHRLLALLSLICLAGGYALALYISSPDDAIFFFFPAVLLVIIGTYGVLLAGSITLLKHLRKKENFYYRPSNFIAVSGMIYRMKRNAIGLATICILSTAVLLTISVCTSLFFGEEDMLNQNFPRDICVSSNFNENMDQLSAIARDYAARHGVMIENEALFRRLTLTCLEEENHFTISSWEQSSYDMEPAWITCIPKEDFEHILGEKVFLSEDEALFYSEDDTIFWDKIQIDEWNLSIKKAEFSKFQKNWVSFFSHRYHGEKLILIVSESIVQQFDTRLEEVRKASGLLESQQYEIYQLYDLSGDIQMIKEYYDPSLLKQTYSENGQDLNSIDTIYAARDTFYEIYGSAFFAGLFFVAIFSIATVLIIYYKQITEGYEDKARFFTMQRIGMSDLETKKVIQRQILLVFFLPLGISLLHTFVAFPALCQVLTLTDLNDFHLFGICTFITAIVFVIWYLIVYLLTAKAYYRIVKNTTTI